MRYHKTMTAIFILILLGFAFCSMGIADENIEFIPGEDAGFYYTIKKGDTLWDLSQKFYDSEWDWPGLWEMNDEIKNPHWIYPGRKIRIYLKGNKLKTKIVKVKKGKKQADAEKIASSFSFPKMDHVGFITKEARSPLGSIITEEERNLMMAKDDIIYIKPSGKGTLIPDKTYHIFSTRKINEKIHDKRFMGIKHLIKGQIKILEQKDNYVTAVITESYEPAFENDLIMEYYERDSILEVEDEPAPIDARIICSEDNAIFINDYKIAFMDVGKDTVKPGQIYTILRENKQSDNGMWQIQKKKDAITFDDLQSGNLIVLHTEEISSTVMILSSKYAIYADDKVN